jgi:hypothetical protein
MVMSHLPFEIGRPLLSHDGRSRLKEYDRLRRSGSSIAKNNAAARVSVLLIKLRETSPRLQKSRKKLDDQYVRVQAIIVSINLF